MSNDPTQELMEEYDVPRGIAEKYLSAQADYEVIRDRLRATRGNLGLSVRNIANLCSVVTNIAESALKTVALEAALDEGDNVHAYDIHVRRATPFAPGRSTLEAANFASFVTGLAGFKADEINTELVWDFDYDAFLDNYAQWREAGFDHEGALQVTSNYLWRGSKCFFSLNGEKMSLQDIEANNDMLINENSSLALETDPAVREDIEGARDRDIGDRAKFTKWLKNGGNDYIPRVMLLERRTDEELSYLYSISLDVDPYRDALKAGTLKTQKVERRIALSSAVSYFDETRPVEGQLDEIIAGLEKVLFNREGRLARAKRDNIDVEEVTVHRDKGEYKLMAVTKHREWLEGMLT